MSVNLNKLRKAYIESKVEEEYIDPDMQPIDIFRLAREKERIYRSNRFTYFTCFKTKHEDKDAILMCFTMELPGNPNSSTSSEIVMSLVSNLERIFIDFDHLEYTTMIPNSATGAAAQKKHVAFLKIVRRIRENDIF